MEKIHFISGLGADERVFQFLHLNGFEQHFVKWESPFHHESLQSYCKRLIIQLDLTNDVVLIGVSFGGIIAQEIAKLILVKKVIIVSSIKSPSEFDWQLKIVRLLNLHKLAPAKFLKWANKYTANYYFGVESNDETKLLGAIIEDTNTDFMVWAIDAILNWAPFGKENVPIYHIHGTSDRIFPITNIKHKNTFFISKGGHFMIVNRSNEVSNLINQVLSLN